MPTYDLKWGLFGPVYAESDLDNFFIFDGYSFGSFFFQTVQTKNLIIDSIIQKEIVKEFHLDSLIHKQNLIKDLSLDSYLQITPLDISILDSYSESNTTGYIDLYSGSTFGAGETFIAYGTGQLTSCKFYLKRSGNPIGNIYAKLFNITGDFGVNAIPVGNSLAISEPFDVLNIPRDGGLVEFIFSNNYEFISGDKYAIIVEYDNGNSNDKVQIACDTSNLTHVGNAVTLS